MRLHVLHHLVVRAEDLRANDAQVFVVVLSLNRRLLEQLTYQHVSIVRRLGVELLVACIAQKVIPRPVLLQSHFKFRVVHDHVSANLELADESFSANVAVMILRDRLFWRIGVFMNGCNMSID